MFLKIFPSLIQLDKNKIVPLYDSPDRMIKFGLSMKCSKDKRNYIYITTLEDNLSYFVLTKKNNKTLEFIRGFVSNDLTIRTIYTLLFSVIGLSVIRGSMFGQTVQIWYTEIPRSEIILVLIDAMNFARFERDLVKEEMLFFLLIDIMRSPEVLKNMTDSLLETREDQFYFRAKRQKNMKTD